MRCSGCGAQVDGVWRWCPECGHVPPDERPGAGPGGGPAYEVGWSLTAEDGRTLAGSSSAG